MNVYKLLYTQNAMAFYDNYKDHIHGINKCNKITLCMSCDEINGY
jgi:hypothetical protein